MRMHFTCICAFISNLHGFELHRPSSKGTKLLSHVSKGTKLRFHVIKANKQTPGSFGQFVQCRPQQQRQQRGTAKITERARARE